MTGKGIVRAVCISEQKGTPKHPIPSAKLIENYGIENDAHAGNWHRQISLLSYEKVEEFNNKGAGVSDGDFGENILVSGIDLKKLPVGTILKIQNVQLVVTQIGKECHSHCAIRNKTGDCIMPREGIFASVKSGGIIKPGDEIMVIEPPDDRPFTAAIITLSDSCAKGERLDESGPLAKEILTDNSYDVVEYIILPDEQTQLTKELIRLCDSRQVDLIVTTGGTGFSPRDYTPEATMAVAERNAPGISEYIRMKSMEITPRAMFGRGVSVIRKKTLIINLPGSKRAVEESLNMVAGLLSHGLMILRETAKDCGKDERK